MWRCDVWKSSAAKALLLVALAVCLAVAVIGCGGDDGGSLVGKWVSEADGETIEFTADGALSITSGADEGLQFSYKVDGDVIRLSAEGFDRTQDVAYSLDGDTLTLQYDGVSAEYVRAK